MTGLKQINPTKIEFDEHFQNTHFSLVIEGNQYVLIYGFLIDTRDLS